MFLAIAFAGASLFPLEAQSAPLVGGNRQGFEVITPDEDSLLLCALTLDNLMLNQVLECYSLAPGIFIPLGTVGRLLEFAVDVQGAQGRASGSLATPKTRFELDMAAGSVSIAGKHGRYDARLIQAQEDDIYVESALLGEWLGMRIDADQHKARVMLVPFELIPLQQRIAREKRGGNTLGYKEWSDPGFPRVAEPYRLLGGPSIDLGIFPSAAFDGSGKVPTSLPFSLLVSGDALWLNGYVSLSGDFMQQGVFRSIPTVVLGRVDPDAGLLGPLHATEVELGVNVSTTLPLIGTTGVGTGFLVSNFSLLQPSSFDSQTLEGPLLPGWDVELYYNDFLLDFRKAMPEGGRYLFANIPIDFGMNDLRLVFRGPLGEERVEEHTYNVGSDMLRPGAYSYRFAGTEEGGGPQMAFEQEIGLTKNLTLESSLLPVFEGENRNLYAGLGLAGYLRSMQGDLHTAYEARNQAWAGDLGLRTQLHGMSLSFRLSGYTPTWVDPSSSSAAPYEALASVSLNGLLGVPHHWIGPYQLNGSYKIIQPGEEEQTFGVTQSHRLGGFSLHHDIEFIRDASGAIESYSLSGSSTATTKFSILSFDGGLAYALYPQPRVSSLWFSPTAKLARQFQVSGMVEHNLGDDLNTISLKLTRAVNPITIGLNAVWSSNNTWSVGLSGSINVSRDSRSGAIVTDANQQAESTAAISARAFLDTNHNGAWDPGEPFLEGVGFEVNSAKDRTRTAADGEAFIRGLSPNLPADVSISLSTLPDVLMTPANKGLSCVPRPGYSVPLDFPIWITGEVTGTVFAKKNGLDNPMPGIAVAICDEHGTTLKSTRSEYDGFYDFAGLLPGTYFVKIQDQSMDAASAGSGKEITIPPTGVFLDQVDLAIAASPPPMATGEITGTVYLEHGDELSAAAGIDVAIRDSQDMTIDTARSEYDGFYNFGRLSPGTYFVRIVDRIPNGFSGSGSGKVVTIPTNGARRDNIDFIITGARLPPAGASEAAKAIEGSDSLRPVALSMQLPERTIAPILARPIAALAKGSSNDARGDAAAASDHSRYATRIVVHFLPDSAVLVKSERARLDRIVATIGKSGERNILVTSHTALRKTEKGRQLLSDERARVVADYLTAIGVTDPSRITIHSLAGTVPAAPNDTESNLKRNRRAEIEVELVGADNDRHSGDLNDEGDALGD